MASKQKYIVGLLLLTILLSGIVYIQFSNQAKLRVDADKTTFYGKYLDDNGEPYGPWRVAGREINSLWDGTSKMNRRSSEITINTSIDEETQEIYIVRTTPYIRGPIIKDTYYFRGDVESIELFPIYHDVEVINGSGFTYQYEVRDLIYDGETIKDITSTS